MTGALSVTSAALAPVLPFRPAPALYSGTGVATGVGALWDCALNGRGYMLDRKSNEHRWGFEQRVRDSVDQSALPGEAAISPQGLWRRAQSSWHLGAGQDYADDAEATDARFSTSKGVDVWTKGQVSLLRTTTQILSSSNSNLAMVNSGSRLYVADGDKVKYTASVSSPSFTNLSGTAATTITGLATDGTFVYIGMGGSGVYRSVVSGSTASSYVTGTVDKVAFVKGRLMVSGGTSIYNPTGSGALPTALFTHANSGWVWTGFAAGQQHIYASGYAGSTSMVYRITIASDAASLSQPVVAAELPRGETVRSIGSYLGFILLGTTKGARFCQADGDGNLVIGALIRTTGTVHSFSASDRFVYFGWSNFDGTSTGIGRMDLSQFTANATPAYASDLMATAQGDVTAVDMFGDDPVFAVSGNGVYAPTSDLVASGSIQSGVFSYGVPDIKVLGKVDLATEPLNGKVTAFVSHDGGDFQPIGSFTSAGQSRTTFTPSQEQSYEIGFGLVLERSSTDSTKGPVVKRFTARTFVSPARSQVVSVPLLLHPRLTVRTGSERRVDVEEELDQLRSLIMLPRTVTYQEMGRSVDVLVEDVTWVPASAAAGDVWAGTAVVTMRTMEG